jgi:predicted DNA-binding transcriptional regulator AlpA
MKKVLRISQIASKPGQPGLLPVSTSTIWRWVYKNNFPKPTKLSAGTSIWSVADIERWMDKCADGKDSKKLESK